MVAEHATVLLYIADADEREGVRLALEIHGAIVKEIADEDEIEQLSLLHTEAVSFVEVRRGDEHGLSIIRRLREVAANGDIVVLSSDHDLACRVAACAAGADDFLSMPVRDIDLEMRLARCTKAPSNDVEISFDAVPTPKPDDAGHDEEVQALKAALRQARTALHNALHAAPQPIPSISGHSHTSDVDELTGLLGAGPLQDSLDREYARARRYGHALSVLVVNVDKMTRYCKRHGNAAGDSALCLIADVLRSALRSPDIVTRCGGDAFAILATDTDGDQALALGNRLRAALAKESKHASAPPVTISIGIASAQRLSVVRATDLLVAAERAVAEAKRTGRDRCCIAMES